ncbi:MAG: hypothetical protein OER96_06050 [Gammaproteobacteria bacterium]|nr:hypothetical protein [Gammaproteobacteria bacterium]
MKKNIVRYLVTLAAGLMPTVTLACAAAGPNTHVGAVLSVKPEQGTFTIRDAQSMGPVTFTASESILESVQNSAGTVFVDFEQDGDTLKALSVTMQ